MRNIISPSYRIEFNGGLSTKGVVTRICPLIDEGRAHQIRYWIDDIALARGFGRSMGELAADLIDVASALYIADRIAPRELPNDGRAPADRWHRTIHVVIPVRQPSRWRQMPIIACLQDLLAFLTDDEWAFAFVHRLHYPGPSEAQGVLIPPPLRNSHVTLLSGGLDSLAGLSDTTGAADVEMSVPVTVVTNSRVRRATKDIVAEARNVAANSAPSIIPIRLELRISQAGWPRSDREPSHRSRSLLFLAAGLSAAIVAGSNKLHVCENGIGALSLPMTPDHWGARATKAMHPKTLFLFQELSSLVLGRPVVVENTGLFLTKAQLIEKLARGGFINIARRTISCDQATYQSLGTSCGWCSSCILRRMALLVAGKQEQVDWGAMSYDVDLLHPLLEWNHQSRHHLYAMRDQVEWLRSALNSEAGFTALDQLFPALFDVVRLAPSLQLTEDEVRQRISRLYRTHVQEMDIFMTAMDRPGWGHQASIAELLPTPTVASVG